MITFNRESFAHLDHPEISQVLATLHL
jgi:hypothetical protein